MARRAVRFNLNSPDVEGSLDEEMNFYESGIARSANEGISDVDIDDEQQTRADEQHRPSSAILDDDDEDAKSPPRVLSVQTSGGKIGCAFFDVTTGKLSLLEDAPEEGRRVHTHSMSVTDDADDDGDHDSGVGQREEAGDKFDTAKETLMTLLEQFAPVNLVLTSSDSSAKFHTAVRKELIYQDSVLSIRPSTEFATTSGMQRIHSLQLQEQKESTAEQQMETNLSASTSASTQASSAHTTTSFGNKLQSSCAVDLHVMPLSVGAAGALLSHLTRIQASFDHSDGYASEVGGGGSSSTENTLKITSIESIVLQDCLSISAESRIALDVFGEESHAALHSASRKHEGLSLFAILDSTRTPLSHSLLRRWLLLPTTDIAVIENRQAAILTFSSHRNTAAIQSITRELKGVKNIPVMVAKLLNGTARLLDWKAILKFCYHALIIREAILDLSVEEPVEVVDKAKAMCDKKVLNFCSQNIAGIIDFDESASESRLCIKIGYDEELDQWKQLYAGLPDLLNKIAQDIRPDVDPTFKEITVCYFPQLGYLLAIPVTEDMSDQLPTLDGWDFQFASENAMYFKGDKMRDLDTHLGDIHTFIVEREIEHLFALQEAICQHASVLLQIADLFAELDCLLALAEAATRFGWVCPEMTQENVIEIYQGRHALQELTVDSFVPNDAYLQGGIPFSQEGDDSAGIEQIQGAKSLLVVTGSNGSGKSIYLKQIALIVLLAHVGSFVPAEGARIGICDQILTSIQARHSVSRLQSSFLLDVSQVGFALRQCTPRSLVLFDEIGKGTDATDGAALFAATVRHLLERPEGCPKTVVATHFHEAFHPAVLPDSLPFQTAHMEVMFTHDSTANGSVRAPGDEMVFLFRLAPGLALTSNAAHLARVFLVPEDVVQRAEHVAELARTHNLAALLLEDDTPSSNSKVTRTSQRGHADSISGGEELSEAGRAAQLRRQDEQAKVEVAERRMRAFLEWELVEDQLDGLDVTDTDAGGSKYPDLIREGLARIMAAC